MYLCLKIKGQPQGIAPTLSRRMAILYPRHLRMKIMQAIKINPRNPRLKEYTRRIHCVQYDKDS